jgi:hypothetical protein
MKYVHYHIGLNPCQSKCVEIYAKIKGFKNVGVMIKAIVLDKANEIVTILNMKIDKAEKALKNFESKKGGKKNAIKLPEYQNCLIEVNKLLQVKSSFTNLLTNNSIDVCIKSIINAL